MYKPTTYLEVAYFPTYLPIYMRPSSYKIGYQIETKWLTQLRMFIFN
jgi:hypothetical protein